LTEGFQKRECELGQKELETREAIKRASHEWTAKLETESKELAAKINGETTERANFQESMLQQIEVRFKCLEDKLALRLKEVQEHSEAVEGQLQSQFRRFTDSCTSAIQDVHKSAISFVKVTETKLDDLTGKIGTNNAELFAKIGQITTEIKSLRSLSAKECAKIGEIIRDEITARFASDMWGKKGTKKFIGYSLQGDQPGVPGSQGAVGDPTGVPAAEDGGPACRNVHPSVTGQATSLGAD
jgi:hypothetical protein